VAPTPVSNKELTLTLAHTLRGKFFIPMHVPAFVLKLMMGQRSIEVLKSATVSARKIQEAGFVFNFPNISSAVNNLLIKKPTSQS
jgi:NAD dependent epimerase/dehydratase family enzyme